MTGYSSLSTTRWLQIDLFRFNCTNCRKLWQTVERTRRARLYLTSGPSIVHYGKYVVDSEGSLPQQYVRVKINHTLLRTVCWRNIATCHDFLTICYSEIFSRLSDITDGLLSSPFNSSTNFIAVQCPDSLFFVTRSQIYK